MHTESSTLSQVATRRRGGKRLWPWLANIALTLLLILVYYTFSIGLTFYQKNLFRDFKFPLTVVVIHLVLKFLLAGFCRFIYRLCTNQPRVTLPWHLYWRRILPPGASAGIDIGLSQWSLEFITITLYTMSKSTALLFILFFAILFKLEEMRWSVVILVVLIAGGLCLFTYKYTQFDYFGFILIIVAAVMSGLRWTLSQIVMQKEELGLSNPIDMVYHIQPWMMLSVLPLAIIMEGSSLSMSELGFRFHDTTAFAVMWFRIMLGGVIAFFMEISEYLLVCFTSSLTLSISGVAKEIATLSLAVYIDHEELSLTNKLGLLCCIIGIILHVVFKTTQTKNSVSRMNSPATSPRNSINSELQTVPLLQDSNYEENVIFTRFMS